MRGTFFLMKRQRMHLHMLIKICTCQFVMPYFSAKPVFINYHSIWLITSAPHTSLLASKTGNPCGTLEVYIIPRAFFDRETSRREELQGSFLRPHTHRCSGRSRRSKSIIITPVLSGEPKLVFQSQRIAHCAVPVNLETPVGL